MAKRSFDERDSERVEIEDKKISAPEEPKTITLQLLKNVKLKIIGKSTGQTYIFHGAGYKLDVDEKDAELMKNKISGSSCCPGSGIGKPTPYFRVVER